jgi:hypothetical protein
MRSGPAAAQNVSGDADDEGDAVNQHTSVPMHTMQQSVVLATSLVSAKTAAKTQTGAAAGGKQERKRRALSMAECQAAALQRAVEAKKRKKVAGGFGGRTATAVVTTRSVGGLDALSALRK